MRTSRTSAFGDFARAWGGVLAHDGTASLDQLLAAYAHLASPALYASCDSDGDADISGADAACECPAVSIDDFTEIWAASKRANTEWEAACMVRSIRRCTAGDLTHAQLVLAMLCWACTQRQQAQRFFKECQVPVRALVHEMVQRCGALAGRDAPVALEDAALCAALLLLGWHDSVLLDLQRGLAHAAPLHSEEDVLAFVRKAAQDVSLACSPRGHSVESTPGFTTSRNSAVSSASDTEPPAPLMHTAPAPATSTRPAAPPTDINTMPAGGPPAAPLSTSDAAVEGDAVTVRSSPAARRAACAETTAVPLPRDRLDRTRAVGRLAATAALPAPPARPPAPRVQAAGTPLCTSVAAPTRRSSAATSTSAASGPAFRRLETAPPTVTRSPARRPEARGTVKPAAAAAAVGVAAPSRRRGKAKPPKEDPNCAVV